MADVAHQIVAGNGISFYFTKQLYTNVVFVLNINWPLGPPARQPGAVKYGLLQPSVADE